VIPSIFDIQEGYTVSIQGEVRKQGDYPFIYNSTVEDLILKAGGLLESASLARIEIARRVKNDTTTNSSDQISEIYQFPISKNLQLDAKASKFILQPFDQVYVRSSPGYHKQAIVKIEGEVAFPGSYSIVNKSERISDLVNRAGGVISGAYPKGARLFRQLPANEKLRLKTLQKLRQQGSDSLNIDYSDNNEITLAIDLDKIIASPKSKLDILLEEGDRLSVPKVFQSVRLSGAVLYPVLVRYERTYRLKKYISMAGGFAENARKGNTYVMYPNGAMNQTRTFLFFRFYPKITPGTEIIVPKKLETPKLSAGEKASIATALTTAAVMIFSIVNQIKW
jgi:protein involved in polysaccharide export with SLBB domain